MGRSGAKPGKHWAEVMRRMDFLRGGAVALAGAMAGSTIMVSARPAASHPVIPNTPVFDQSGRRLHFYDDLIHGKAVLLNFFYTSCGDTCPLVTQNLREVQDILGPRMGRDKHMASIKLQPQLETPEILRDYVGLWDIRPGWTFLTGRPEDVDQLRRATGFADSEPDVAGNVDSHTGMVRYGNDRLDRWGCAAGTGRPAWIAKAVTMLADMG